MLEIVVADIQQRVPQVEVDVSAHHTDRERQARRRAVGIRRRYARACRGQQGAVAAPEVEVETEVERHPSVARVAAGEGRREQPMLRVSLAGGLGGRESGG